MSTDTTTHGHQTHTAAAPATEPATPEKTPQKTTKAHHDDDKAVKAQQAALEFPIKDVIPGKNVRTGALPDIAGLAETIKKDGIIEPLIGIPGEGEGKVVIIAGFRRYFAAKSAGLKTVPVRLVTADEAKRLRLALIENLQRADLNPMDKATAMKQMQEDGLDQKEIASQLGVSPGFVSQHLSLFNLPKKAQDHVAKGKLELTHARELVRIKDEEVVESMLEDAEVLNASDLKNKVDFFLEKQRAKAEEEKKKTPAKKSNGKEKEEATPKKSLAERYAEMELEPLKKNDLREQLQIYATKLERAESENKRLEYKFILKGMEIAAGLKE
jgi:ParB family chromosome partitioning protein